MPRVSKELSALAVRNVVHSGKTDNPERVAVGGVSGLLLQVTSNNAKSWLLRTTIHGKRQFMGLGPYPEVSLSKAREEAADLKAKIRNGEDPRAERREAKASRVYIFADVLEEFLSEKLKDKGEKCSGQWQYTLTEYALPTLGPLNVDNIEPNHILRILQPLWTEKTETASRLRGRIESVLSFAIARGYRKNRHNPARWQGNLKEILPAPSKIQKVTHQPAVPLDSIQAWYTALRETGGMSALALEFLTLTACRSGEVRGAVWSEIDLERRLWIIPAERMKLRREHRVPLCERALQILTEAPRFEESPYVFPAARGGQLSDMALSKKMKDLHKRELRAGRPGWIDKRSGRPAVPHGLRSSYREYCGERTDHPRELVELCLAHNLMGSVERAYMRSDVLEKRRAIMNDWADFLTGGE